jgi:hypothetical protein
MTSIESYRKQCLKQQTDLRRLMTSNDRHGEAIQLFFTQHAMLHSAGMARTGLWSFEDAVLDDMPEELTRTVPPGADHSVAWLIWHLARCEDITMNLLVAGSPQVLFRDSWLDRMQVPGRDTGNAMDEASIVSFSAAIDVGALRAFRLAVGRRTREIVKRLQPGELRRKVEPARLQRVMDEGAVVDAARGIVDYWGKRNVAGLLLMPATRHCLVHLNEALKLKRSRR